MAIAEADGEVCSLGIIPNRAESVRKLVKKDLVRAREAAKQDQLRAPSVEQVSAAHRAAAGRG